MLTILVIIIGVYLLWDAILIASMLVAVFILSLLKR
jgi:hypothetical protein